MDGNSQLLLQTIDGKARTHGWIWSVVSHGVLVTALAMSVEPIPVAQEIFQWNVDIVSNGSSVSHPDEATAEPSVTEDSSNKAATPASKRSSSLASKLKEPMLKPSAMRESVLMAEPTSPVAMRASQHAEIQTKPSETAEPPSDSVPSTQPTSEPQVASAPSSQSPSDSNERQSTPDSAQGSETASSPPQDTRSNERAVPASHALSAGDAKRPDYGWLAAALRARIEEIKRYSEQARSNGWEGRVVVATTVQGDGRLMDIRVIESSGHGSLDEDAKHILRDASPMVLTQPLEAVHVTVKVPIVFGLH